MPPGQDMNVQMRHNLAGIRAMIGNGAVSRSGRAEQLGRGPDGAEKTGNFTVGGGFRKVRHRNIGPFGITNTWVGACGAMSRNARA